MATTWNNTNITTTYAEQSDTDIWLIFYKIATGICVAIFFTQILSILYNRARIYAEDNDEHEASRKRGSVIILAALFLAYFLNTAGIVATIARINQWPNCASCSYAHLLNFGIYATTRMANYFFFLQRAYCAQGMTKILSDKMFRRYVPIFIVTIWIIFMGLIIKYQLPADCTKTDRTGRDTCLINYKHLSPAQITLIGLQTLYDDCFAIFFLYLFGKPVCDIYKSAKLSSIRNKNFDKENRKLKRTMITNFSLSLVCILSTTIIANTFSFKNDFSHFIRYWYPMDFLVNSICLFTMLGSNRRLFVYALGCFDCQYINNYLISLFNKQNKHHVQMKETDLKLSPSQKVALTAFDYSKNSTGDNNNNTIITNLNTHNNAHNFNSNKNINKVKAVSNSNYTKDEHIRSQTESNSRFTDVESTTITTTTTTSPTLPTSANTSTNFLYNNICCCYCKCINWKFKLFWVWFIHMFCCCYCQWLKLQFPYSHPYCKAAKKDIRYIFHKYDFGHFHSKGNSEMSNQSNHHGASSIDSYGKQMPTHTHNQTNPNLETTNQSQYTHDNEPTINNNNNNNN